MAPIPKDLGIAGRRLWRDIAGRFDLDTAEQRLLLEACRTSDSLDALAEALAAAGPVTEDGKVHPALVEARQQRLVLARLIASLRIPPDEDEPENRPQRRSGARGTYAARSSQ